MSWIAFLRAVNVGGRTVKMARVRALFEALKFRDVSTFIASGNVRFAGRGEAAALERRIQCALAETFGFEVTTFLRSPDDLALIAGGDPFDTAPGEALSVGFLKQAPDAAALVRVAALRSAHDDLLVTGREVWWRCRGRVNESRVWGGPLERALGVPMTMRNINTVRKLAALSAPGGARP